MSYKPPNYRELSPAAGISREAQQRKGVRITGDIRAQKPMFDSEKCVKCQLCMILCPEGCVYEKDDGAIDVSLTFCKGCGICAHECPVDAIAMVGEKV